MNPTHKTLVILFLALCIMVPYGYAANIISANPSSVSLHQGSDQTATIIVDDLPNGLSGYYFQVSLADPSMGKIVSVQYPQWAVINATEGLPNASVNISAVDLIDQINAGAKSVTLATITIRGDRTGSTSILIDTMKLDGDKGVGLGATPVQTTQPISAATTSVPVTANHGSYGNSGGGGSYSSGSSGTSEPGVTAAPTVIRTSAAVQSAAGDSVPGAPGATYPQSPPADRVTSGPVATTIASQSAIPALPAGIPGWVPAGTGIIVVVVAGGLMYMTYKKKL
jgi:hypothetical protein